MRDRGQRTESRQSRVSLVRAACVENDATFTEGGDVFLSHHTKHHHLNITRAKGIVRYHTIDTRTYYVSM